MKAALYDSLCNINDEIQEIRLFKYNVEAVRKFSFGVWTSRQHVFIAVKTADHIGYGENIISINDPDVSLDEWIAWARILVGKSISEALHIVRDNLEIWRDRFTEMTEMALIDLAGKEKGVSAVSLLGLNEIHNVNGAFVVLNDDPDYVSCMIDKAVKRDLSQVIKVKLFGNLDTDIRIIKAVRKNASRKDSYLIGDVNTGYGRDADSIDMEYVTKAMHILYNEGLDACEDPAALDVNQYTVLQKEVSPLSLIPDVIMRPSWKSIDFIKPGMADICNIHPGSAGSIIDAVELARKIKSNGAGVMIGDDSLIGPACTGWQQIAIALGARWVEAVEKDDDSDSFKATILECATDSSINPIGCKPSIKGFGLLLDEKLLSDYCTEEHIVISGK